MIQSNELRIGNYISSRVNMRPQMKVLQLFGDSFQGDFGNGSRGGIMYENTEGITLTEEWLIKFGFEKMPPSFENCINPYWVKNTVVLFFTNTPPLNTYLLSIGFTFDGKYYAAASNWVSEVHLLQNYYYAHIGQELTISEPTKQSEGMKTEDWISVKDRLPEIGSEVIVFSPKSNDGYGRVTALARYIRYEGATKFHWDNDYPGHGNMYIQDAITHWMPLPEPPKP